MWFYCFFDILPKFIQYLTDPTLHCFTSVEIYPITYKGITIPVCSTKANFLAHMWTIILEQPTNDWVNTSSSNKPLP